MIQTTLEFTVAIKANEATLHDLQNQLNSTDRHPSALGEALPLLLKELVAVGASADVEIELHPGQIVNRYQGPGQFSSKLWLETNNPAGHLDDEIILLKTLPPNEILCSD